MSHPKRLRFFAATAAKRWLMLSRRKENFKSQAPKSQINSNTQAFKSRTKKAAVYGHCSLEFICYLGFAVWNFVRQTSTTCCRKWRLVFFLPVLISFFLLETSIQAQESSGAPGVLLRMPVGARALGTGGAFTAQADDASSVYWNPAAVYLGKGIAFEFMNSQMGHERMVNFAASTMPLSSDFGIGMYWTGFQIAGIEARAGNSAAPDFVFDSNHHTLGLSVGHWLTYNTAIGLTAKFFTTNLSENAATGFGFDFGLRLEPMDGVVLGGVARNLMAGYKWETHREKIPLTFRGGLALKPHDLLTLMMDVEQTPGSPLGFHFGTEVHAASAFPIRFGYDAGRLTGGFGIEMDVSAHEVGVSYSYANDRILNQGLHTFSLFVQVGDTKRFTYSQEKGNGHVVVRTTVLNVRHGPGVEHSRIGKVLQGQRFELLERKGDWTRIRLADGRSGWVHIDYVIIIDG
jgi:hypothetical protein